MLPIRLLFACLLGVFFEYFDFVLYGFSASYIVNAFFPEESRAVGLLLTWGIFAISFIVRPLGAFVFGHYGDRLGRRTVLPYMTLFMGFATVAIGCLPTYAHIGIAAPILLILCRIVQGFAVSTEYSGCAVYLMEYIPKHRGFFSGVITSASGFGIFAASMVVLLFNSSTVQSWLPNMSTWRLPFIVAGLLVAVLGFYLRRRLAETPLFLKIQRRKEIAKVPLVHLWKTQKTILMSGILLSVYVGVAIIVVEVYLPHYLQNNFHINVALALKLSTAVALIEAVLAIFMGWLSDHIGRVRLMEIAGAAMFFLAIPTLYFMNNHALIYPLMFLFALLVAAVDGPIVALLFESFSTSTRYTGVSISYSVGAALFGGLSPVFLQFGQRFVQWQILPALYLMFFSVLFLVALYKKAQLDVSLEDRDIFVIE